MEVMGGTCNHASKSYLEVFPVKYNTCHEFNAITLQNITEALCTMNILEAIWQTLYSTNFHDNVYSDLCKSY